MKKLKMNNIKIINLKNFFKYLFKIRYFHFFLTGVSGVLINILFSWLTVNFLLTQENYYIFNSFFILNTTIGIIIGISLNLIYNFIIHSLIVFKTKKNHKKRFIYFISYSLIMSFFIQLPLILFLRNILNNFFINYSSLLTINSYLISTMIIILIFSIVTFIFFNRYLFNEK